MYYRSETDYPAAGFRFGVRLEEGIALLNYYSRTEDGVYTPITKGSGYIECFFPSFPLASGRYIIMIAITEYGTDYLYRSQDYGVLEVLPELVPGARRALDSKHCLISVEHEWRMRK